MPWTLQFYIFREMGRSFVLTAIGLVAVIGLGGGVTNMIKLEGVSASQLLKIMALFLPLAATITLPVAALFAATQTYGRLSANNEFVACRSCGINLHVLFLPTLVLSLFSAACSFLFFNFAIPGIFRNIDRFISADLPRMIKSKLASPERLSLGGNYVFYADRTEVDDIGEDDTTRTRLALQGAAFLESSDGNWLRFGTAQTAAIEFDVTRGAPTVASDLYHATFYDMKEAQFVSSRQQSTGAFTLRERLPLKVKWLNLGELLQYRRHPSLFPDVVEGVAMVRQEIGLVLFYRDLRRQFAAAIADENASRGLIRFRSGEISYTVRARSFESNDDDGRPTLRDQVEVIESHDDGHERRASGSIASFDRQRDRGMSTPLIYLKMQGDVTILDPLAPSGVIRRKNESFPALPLPAEFVEQAGAVTDLDILDKPPGALPYGEFVDKVREELRSEYGQLQRDITGVFHGRIAFSLSALVLVILGAALGIVFRGAHILIAFGISFVPSLFLITMVIMGKQLIDSPATTSYGIAVTWMGIVIVAGLDLFVLMRLVRR